MPVGDRHGGNAGENPDGIYADAEENVYLSGYTRSTDFPVTDAALKVHGGQKAVFVKLSAVKNAFQATFAGNGDAMVTKLVPVTDSR